MFHARLESLWTCLLDMSVMNEGQRRSLRFFAVVHC
jgi:hypothetical protein